MKSVYIALAVIYEDPVMIVLAIPAVPVTWRKRMEMRGSSTHERAHFAASAVVVVPEWDSD